MSCKAVCLTSYEQISFLSKACYHLSIPNASCSFGCLTFGEQKLICATCHSLRRGVSVCIITSATTHCWVISIVTMFRCRIIRMSKEYCHRWSFDIDTPNDDTTPKIRWRGGGGINEVEEEDSETERAESNQCKVSLQLQSKCQTRSLVSQPYTVMVNSCSVNAVTYNLRSWAER